MTRSFNDSEKDEKTGTCLVDENKHDNVDSTFNDSNTMRIPS
jgi:hypothetical protein